MTERTGGAAASLTPLQKALLTIERLQGRVRRLEAERGGPIAVVGIGCRTPAGGRDAGTLFEALLEGRDGIRPAPGVARPWWPADADAAELPPAGYLEEDIRGFDPGFFGISPREAASIDPQHRLVLECAWEALESAGIDPHSLHGSRGGVFLGMAGNDYANVQLRSERAAQLLHSHFASGTGHSMASGRLSYLLGMHGPSLTVDTACSSSLVAVHLACQSLRNGETDIALAAGVNLILATDYTNAFHQARMLAPDGRCKAFDASADGFGRAEGCGVVVLKRLDEAQRDGDPILAVIRGSAVNQDGPSSGLTAPNGPAQEAVIRAALAQAQLTPGDIGYVEAHGTGTELGDPIEAQALGNVFGVRLGAGDPLLIGSVKSNLGHLEAAAGITGLIKVVEAVRRGVVPASLHFSTPNPHIPWDELPLAVATQNTPFPAVGGGRRAGVSSFGFSGTNAHVIVEEPPAPVAAEPVPERVRVLALSAADEPALRARASEMARVLADRVDEFADLCHTANAGRAHLEHRLAIRAADAREAGAALLDWLQEPEPEGFIRAGRATPGDVPALAFLFTGQGAQYAGMGWALRQQSPIVRKVLDEVDEALAGQIEVPLARLLDPSAPEAELVNRTDLTQPALFALQLALAEMWRSWGVRPSLVLGHSIGEYAAACLAGVFTVEDAARVVAARGRLMHEVTAQGRMIALTTDEARAARLVEEAGGAVSIAALNAPGQVVVAGAAEAVGEVEATARSGGIEVKSLRTSQAFHSPLMDPVVPRMEEVVRGVALRPAERVRFVSSVTGAAVAPAELTDPAYWARQIRLPVRFADAAATAASLVPRAVEIGPHPTLSGLVAMGGSGWAVHPSLHREQDAWVTVAGSVAELYTAGVPIVWRELESDRKPRIVDLPRYPFQRMPLWVDTGRIDGGGRRVSRDTHPLLGERVSQPGDEASFEARLGADSPAFIGEHRVLGAPILPGTAYLEMALAGGRAILGGTVGLREVQLLEPMDFSVGDRLVHTRIHRRDGSFRIFSAPTSDPESWTLHCSGTVATEEWDDAGPDLAEALRACDREVEGDWFSASLASRGYDFGPRLRGVERVRAGAGIALGSVRIPDACADDEQGYFAHPLLLDAAVQTIGATLQGNAATRTWVPQLIERVSIAAPVSGSARVHARVEQLDEKSLRATVTLLGSDDSPIARLEGMRFRELSRAESDPFLEVQWVATDPDPEERRALRSELAGVMSASLRTLSAQEDAAAYDRFVDGLEQSSARYVRDALVALGWNPSVGEVVRADVLHQRLGVVPVHRRLFRRMLAIAAEEGVLEPTGHPGEWRVRAPLESWRPPLDEHGNGGAPRAERVLLDRCGPALAELLRGIGDPLELLFHAGGADDAERMYYDAPFARIFNGTIAEVVAAAAAARPEGTPLRVLEVGGGTAGTTRRILDRVDAAGLRLDYTFTDISPAFIERGRERWAGRDDVLYRTFDLDRDPAEQGFELESFDLVVAANCLHAARDLGAALRRVRSLLRPGGMLAAVEVFGPHRWFDLTVGLTEGWWHFTDEALRPDYACIDAATWTELLGATGFEAQSAGELSLNGGSDGYASRNQGMVVAYRAPEAAPGARWLLGGGGPLVVELAAELAQRGCDVTRTPLSEVSVALERAGGEVWQGIVLCEPGAGERQLRPGAIAGAVRGALEPLIGLAGPVARGAVRAERLYILTRGAQVATPADVDVDPSAATVWGLARTLELELPELPVRRLDLDSTPHRDEAPAVAAWLLDPGSEPELAWRFGALLARRVAPRRDSRPQLPAEYRLVPPSSRSFDELAFSQGSRRAPGAGEVEIRAVASAMNFKDVLNVLGMYPGDPGPLGSECAGVVTAVGDGVSLPVGAPVMVAAGHAYGRHVIADARMVAPKPASMSFAEAAGLPIAYLTAHFALSHLAGIGAGDRVLVHAAAGGVGLAAVAIAQRAGAEVIATAGSEWKRDLLRARGVQHVFDSRSDSFAAGVLEVTGGAGVTVVLNSLADELIGPTFEVTAPGGRFLEIGKRGIWTPEQVAALGKGIDYHVIDWGETARHDPEVVGRLFAEVMQQAADGELPPLPVHTFPLEKVADAFRYMAQGRHAGKIVLRHPVLTSLEAIRIQPAAEGAYLITGGTGGLGLGTAEWMADQGATSLVLVSRGGVRPENEARVAALRGRGVGVMVVEADVGRREEVERISTALREAGILRLHGVVHSAGALANRTLQQATWEDFEQVLRAKVHGTALLAQELAGFGPGFFVCYSSIASVFGAPGQANHSAANAFEDAFAGAFWSPDRVAMSIAWGPWSETGAAASAEVLDLTRSRGLSALSTREGLRWLGQAFARPAAQLVGARIVDPDALGLRGGRLLEALRPRAEQEPTLAAGAPHPPARPPAPRFLDEFDRAPVDTRRTLVLNRVRTRIRRVLGLPAGATLDANRPLGEIGLDSLLAVELRNVLADDVEQRLPATLLFDHATPAALADYLLVLLQPPAVVATPTAVAEPTGSGELLGALESLDDDDIDRLLAEKLKS